MNKTKRLMLAFVVFLVFCFSFIGFGQDLNSLTKSSLDKGQLHIRMDSGVDFSRNQYERYNYNYYYTVTPADYYIFNKETEDNYESWYFKPSISYGVTDFLSIRASGDIAVNSDYEMKNSWYQISHFPSIDPTRNFTGVYSGDKNQTYRKNFDAEFEINYRPCSKLELYLLWSMDKDYFYSQDNYRHSSNAANPNFAFDYIEVLTSEDNNMTNTVSLGTWFLLGDGFETGSELDLNAWKEPFLSPMAFLGHVEAGIDIVDNEYKRWYNRATDYWIALQQSTPVYFIHPYEEDYSNISRTVEDDYVQAFLLTDVKFGLPYNLNVGISGRVDFPVEWDRDITRNNSPRFYGFSSPTRRFWGDDDSGEIFSWEADLSLAYRPTPYLEIALNQGINYREATYDGFYYTNVLSTAAGSVADGSVTTKDVNETIIYTTTLSFAFLTKGSAYDFTMSDLNTIDIPLLGKNQFGMTAFLTFVYVDAEKEYEYIWHFPTIPGYPTPGIDYYEFDLSYHQFILGLNMSYGILDNLTASAGFSYSLPTSYINDAMYRWYYNAGDFGWMPCDDLDGKREGWTTELDVRYRPVENVEIGLGGSIEYSQDENRFYDGPFIWVPAGAAINTTREWGDKEESYNYTINLSLQYLF